MIFKNTGYFNQVLKKVKPLFFLLFAFFTINGYSQNYDRIVESLSFKDKLWVAKNINSVISAKKISEDVVLTMDSLNKENFLGGNQEGGLFDAFRHIYWMYNLAVGVGDKKAKRIGVIYEKYNKYLFDNYSVEGYDEAGMQMDLFNNDLGISISDSDFSKPECIVFIKNLIFSGKAKVIKKNLKQESLSSQNEVIADSIWKKSWVNERVLIYSDMLPQTKILQSKEDTPHNEKDIILESDNKKED